MWKNLDDTGGSLPEFSSKPTPESGDPSDESSISNRFEKWSLAAGAQKAAEQDKPSPSAANMTTYTEALNEFTRSATAFIEQLPLLTKAREAYEQAMKASAELRKVLDIGEENLQSLMTQLEQAVSIHGVKPADKKRPELAKVEAIRGTEEGTAAVNRYP